ncbi:MAG: hypothetical protein WBL40_02875 [Terrimicrobiaceae bacterium]
MIANGWDQDEEDAFDRPELPREVPFEQELAAIPPEARQALQEEFLAGLYEQKDEGKVSHAAMVAEATRHTREFLLACHDEKWRKQKTSPCYEPIAKAPLADIARRTLTLMCNGSVPQDKALALVITEIEAEDYARAEMALGGTYEEGIEKFRLSRQTHANHLDQLARMPKWEWQHDEQGNKPVPFEDGLKTLFPLPGWKGARRRDEQVRRFTDFLTGIVRDEHSNAVAAEEERERLEEERLKRLKDRLIKVGQRVSEENGSKPLSEQGKWSLVSETEREQIRAEAERRLREMKCDGIPAHLFRVAILWVDELYKERVSAKRSEASRARWSARTK